MEASKVKVKIAGIVPILFDRNTGVEVANSAEAKKEAINRLYLNDAGKISIPAGAIKAAIREASSGVGNKQGGKVRRNAVRAGLFIAPDMIPLGAKEPDGIHAEYVSRKTGSKITRVVSYRPFLKNWECEFEVSLYGITVENFKQYLELAGLIQGLCGHRPEYGRFEVVSFEEIG